MRKSRLHVFVMLGAAALLLGGPTPLQAAETKTATGVITSKTFKPATVYKQYPAGEHGGFWDPAEIPIAECFVFEIKVKGLSDAVRYPLNTVASRYFRVGQKVRIEYVKRAILPFRTRIYVREMKPVE